MTQDEMKDLRDYFDGKFEGMEKRFDQRLDDMDKRFDAVDARFDGVDQRFVGVDQQLAGIHKRFDRIDATLEQEFGAITTQFVELRGYIDDAYERTNERIDVQVEALRADLRITRERE